MKKLLTFILFTGLVGYVWAQKIDPEAKKILDNASEKLSKSTTFYIKFDYLYTVPGQKSTKETGRVYAAKEKYHLILPNISQIFDGMKVVTVSKEDKEITISDNDGEESLSPTNILNLYKKGFDISLEKEKIINGVKCNVVKLTPIDNKKSREITLALNEGRLVEVSENYKDGGSLTLTIVEFKENLIVNKSLLSFNKNQYKGYTITEL